MEPSDKGKSGKLEGEAKSAVQAGDSTDSNPPEEGSFIGLAAAVVFIVVVVFAGFFKMYKPIVDRSLVEIEISGRGLTCIEEKSRTRILQYSPDMRQKSPMNITDMRYQVQELQNLCESPPVVNVANGQVMEMCVKVFTCDAPDCTPVAYASGPDSAQSSKCVGLGGIDIGSELTELVQGMYNVKTSGVQYFIAAQAYMVMDIDASDGLEDPVKVGSVQVVPGNAGFVVRTLTTGSSYEPPSSSGP